MKRMITGITLIIMAILGAQSVQAAETNELQELIDNTPEKGVLELEAKTYEGNVVIKKPMTMKGQKGTKIHGDKKSKCH